jgi:hypothetical protein
MSLAALTTVLPDKLEVTDFETLPVAGNQGEVFP